ncbi:MAG TPA: HlyD family efflux transporter periplasmic adaptor subunit [Planctomycetota bacterium]|nr:HlyD family efflux transporter periplasmic adaptor subunit [Planctomycetota bacterium]
MVKKLVWTFILLLIAGAAAIIYLGSQKQHADDNETVSRGPIQRVATGNGRIEGVGEATPLSFPLPGQIEWIDEKVVDGHEVELGDVLARLNSAELDVKISSADAALKIAQSKYDLAKLGRTPESIKQAEEKLKQAEEEVKAAEIKLKFLREPSAPPPAQPHEIAEAQRKIDAAQAKLVLAQVDLAKLKEPPTAKDLAVLDVQVQIAEEAFRTAEKALKVEKDKWNGGNNASINKLEGEVEQARKRLQLAEAERDRLKQGPSKHEIAAAEQRVKLAQTEVEGAEAAKKLLEKPPVPPPASEQAIAEAKVALLQAQASQRAAKAAVDDLKRGPEEAEIKAAQAAVEQAEKSKKLLELQKEALKLRAPFSGRVVRRHLEPGALVNAFTPVITIVDFSSKLLRTEFDVGRLSDIKKDMKVTLRSKALKEELDGTVEKIVGVGTRRIFQDDPGAPKGGEVVEVLIRVSEPTGDLKKHAFELLLPGLRMDAAVMLERRDNVLRVQKGYVSNDGKEYVWCKPPTGAGDPVRRDVKCGLRDEQFVEILEGLSEAEVVVKPRPKNR